MLNIVFNGIKPNEYKFEYSIQGNNKVDYICFSFNGNMPSGKPFLKIESKDKSYIDKIDLTSMVESNHIHFPLLAKTTAHKVIKAQLQFETEDTCYQTEIVEIMLKNTIKADEEIENNYPSILTSLQEQLDAIKGRKASKDFVHFEAGQASSERIGASIVFEKEAQVLFTESFTKSSHLTRFNGMGTKYANKITKFSYSDEVSFNRFIRDFFDIDDYEVAEFVDIASSPFKEHIYSYFPRAKKYIQFEKEQAGQSGVFTGTTFSLVGSIDRREIVNFATDCIWGIDNRGQTFHNLYRTCKHLEAGKHEMAQDRNQNYVVKAQFKFVSDFVAKRAVNHSQFIYKWEGNMANQYLDLLVFFHFNDSEVEDTTVKILFVGIPRRF